MIFPVVCRTSSTSVEQARERSYHRALLLSKDKDTGENKDASLIDRRGFQNNIEILQAS